MENTNLYDPLGGTSSRDSDRRRTLASVCAYACACSSVQNSVTHRNNTIPVHCHYFACQLRAELVEMGTAVRSPAVTQNDETNDGTPAG
jgi:hypothetical protein